jgi:hypothetical protein
MIRAAPCALPLHIRPGAIARKPCDCRMKFAVIDDSMDAQFGRFRASMDNIMIRQSLLATRCPWMPTLAEETRMVQLK